NTASRMESNSLPGRIQSSEVFSKLLQQQAPHIEVTCRGKIPIKGKGEMKTYWIGLEETEKMAHRQPPEEAAPGKPSAPSQDNNLGDPVKPTAKETFLTEIEC
ncbi:Receptor-type guanylate cyclase gcy (Partial), partial [Seminavis robusta]